MITFLKTKNNTYILDSNSHPHYCSYILINDTIKVEPHKESEISVTPVKVVACSKVETIVGYKNKDDQFITDQDYKLKLAEFQKYADSDGIFKDLDREYDCKKFMIIWEKVVYKTEIQTSEIEFNIRNLVYSEHSDIYPLHQYGANISNPTCHLKLNIKQVLKDVATELGMYAYYEKKYSECKIEIGEAMAKGKHIIEIADNSGIRFSKLDRNYIKGFENFESDIITFTGTYDECVKYKNEKYEYVKNGLIKLCASVKTNLLKFQEIDTILSKLALIHDDFITVTPHSKNYKEFSRGLAKLQNLCKELQELKKELTQ